MSARPIHWRRSSAIIGTDPVQALLAKERQEERRAKKQRALSLLAESRKLRERQS